jgi:hypothetical protein
VATDTQLENTMPIGTTIAIVGGIALLCGGAGGFGIGVLVKGKRDRGAKVVVDDRAAVESEKTEQAQARVFEYVCTSEFVSTQGEGLCRLAICGGAAREDGGGLAGATCDTFANMDASLEGLSSCQDFAMVDGALDMTRLDKCLSWLGQRK